MRDKILRIAASAVVAVLITGPASAQSDADWNALLEKAKGQTVVMMHQGDTAFDEFNAEFTKKFGIKVESSASRPSQALARIRTEQRNGQHAWDIWWSNTSNMVNVAAPAGMLEKFEPYLVLPEVKDKSNWRHPSFLMGDSGGHVFIHSNEISFGVFRNTDVVPEVKVEKVADINNPKLKGMVGMREASRPNSGSFALATIAKATDTDFMRRFLNEMQPKVFSNPKQLDTALIRGGMAVVSGMQTQAFAQCRKDGGCKNIVRLKDSDYVLSRGIAVFKNPPHPEAAKVWINWFLSKEGQRIFVDLYAKSNITGAVSMRKDVDPHPGHADYLPDFAKPDQYVWAALELGRKDILDAVKVFKAEMEKK